MNILAKLIASSALVGSALCTVSPVHLNFGCLKQFSGDVSYNDTQLIDSLLVRFRNNYHCYNWCDYYNIQISPNPEFAKAVLGKFDLSKTHDCTEWYNQYYAPKAMIRTGGKVKTFSTPVDENKEVSGWVAMDSGLKFNNTHWKIVLNKPIEMIQVPLMFQDRHKKLVYTRFDFQDPELQKYLKDEWKVDAFQADKRECKNIVSYTGINDEASNEVLLFNPEYTLVVNHQCLMAIQMLTNLQIQNDFSQERCLSLEKNDWKVTPQNGGWHDAKECTHDDVRERLQWVDAQNHYYENVTYCKTIPFARGDNYISCTDGQRLQVIPNFDEDVAVKVFFAFAKTGASAVPLIGNVLSSIVDYLNNPKSLKVIAKGIAADIGKPIGQLSTKADVINRIAQTLVKLA